MRCYVCDKDDFHSFERLHPERELLCCRGCGAVMFKVVESLRWAEADAQRQRWANEAAFIQAMIFASGSMCGAPVHVIASERTEPYCCGIWRFCDETLNVARVENESAIRRLNEAQKNDHFPTGYEEVRLL